MLRQVTSLGHLCSGSEVEQRGFSSLASAQTIPKSGIIKWALRPLWQTVPLVLRGHQNPSQRGHACLGLLMLRWKQAGNVVICFDQSVHFRETWAWVWGCVARGSCREHAKDGGYSSSLHSHWTTCHCADWPRTPGRPDHCVRQRQQNHPGRQHKGGQPIHSRVPPL